MLDAGGFLKAVMPRLTDVEKAFCNGDASPREAMWSSNDPVTLFGALYTRVGWREIRPAFEALATTFSNLQSWEYEVLSAGASGDLGYIVGIEHKTVSTHGAPPQPYSLRVTLILRREAGEWRVIHRHGDPHDPAADAALSTRKSA